MTYLIFARKYRPQTFEEVIGQRSVVQTIQNAIRTGRITQAYLFSGVRGTGKTSVARILAKALNCINGPTHEPCNTCEFCTAINDDKAIDVLEIDGASNRGIDEIRALREALKYKAIHSRFKVVIIDEVHQITKDGFNALLKTLEEPPPNTIFVFATTEFHKVPATIVSRCQHFEFKKISHKAIINHLMEISKKENITITPYGLTLIAEAADGSMRDGQSLLDQAVAFSGENIRDEDLKLILGAIGQEILFRASSAICGERPQEIFPLVESVISSGYDLRFFYSKLIEHFRALLLVGSVEKPEDLLLVNTEELEALRKQAAKGSPEEFLRYLIALQQGEAGLKNAVQPRIFLETLLIKLCHYKKIVPLESLLRGIPREKTEQGGTGPKPHQASVRPLKSQKEILPSTAKEVRKGEAESLTGPPEKDIKRTPIPEKPSVEPTAKEIFSRVLEKLQKDKAALAAVLAQFSSVRFRDNLIEVFFENGKGFFADTVKKDIKTVEKAASEVLGRQTEIRLAEEIGGNPESGQTAQEMESALKDPAVQHFMNTFKAQVLSVDPVKRASREKDTKSFGPGEREK